MISYIFYNLIAMNLADVSRFLNLVSKLKVLTKSFPKIIICRFSLKVMTSHSLSIEFVVIALMTMKFGTDIKLDVFYIMVTKNL